MSHCTKLQSPFLLGWGQSGWQHCPHMFFLRCPLLPFEFSHRTRHRVETSDRFGACVLWAPWPALRWLPLLDIPLAACTSPIKAPVMTRIVSVSLDSQAWEPLRTGAKAATFSLCPQRSVQSQAGEGAQKYQGQEQMNLHHRRVCNLPKVTERRGVVGRMGPTSSCRTGPGSIWGPFIAVLVLVF